MGIGAGAFVSPGTFLRAVKIRSYLFEFPDPNDHGGGSVSLVNPYRHSSWAKQSGPRAF